MTTILLDAGPLGLITNPRPSPQAIACRQWLDDWLARGHLARVPEITDYELRRELLRARKTAGLRYLDDLAARIGYLPLTTATMRQAAAFWAYLRQHSATRPVIA